MATKPTKKQVSRWRGTSHWRVYKHGSTWYVIRYNFVGLQGWEAMPATPMFSWEQAIFGFNAKLSKEAEELRERIQQHG